MKKCVVLALVVLALFNILSCGRDTTPPEPSDSPVSSVSAAPSEPPPVHYETDKEVVMKDYLNQTWVNEFYSYPFEPAEDCHADSVRLFLEGKEIACQLSDIEYKPGSATLVKSAMINFIVDKLEPLSTNIYEIAYGAEAATPQEAGDLTVTVGDGSVEISTSKFGIKLPTGEKAYADAEPSAVQGPVVSLRNASGGEWFGGSELYGNKTIESFEGTITGNGPVFASVRLTYAYTGGETIVFDVMVINGDEKAIWDMATDDPGDTYNSYWQEDGWKLKLPGWPLDIMNKEGNFYFNEYRQSASRLTVDFDSNARAGNAYFNSNDDLDKNAICTIVPWDSWWDTRCQTILNFMDPSGGWRFAANDADQWADREVAAEYSMWAEKPKSLAFMWWKPPQTLPVLKNSADREWEIYFRMRNGERLWEFGPGAGVSGQLNKLQDQVLDWEEPANPDTYYATASEIAAYRQKAQSRPDYEATLLSLIDGAWDGNANLGVGGGNLNPNRMRPGVQAYLMSGTEETARDVHLRELALTIFDWCVESIRWARDNRLFTTYNLPEGHKYAGHPVMWFMNEGPMVSNIYEIAKNVPSLFTEAELKTMRSQLAYIAYYISSPEYWSTDYNYCSGNEDMTVKNELHTFLVSACIPNHPMTQEWSRASIASIDNSLRRIKEFSGMFPENKHYAYVSLGSVVPAAIVARNAGLGDQIDDPLMVEAVVNLVKMHTPPDLNYSNQRTSYPNSRGNAGERHSLAGIAAAAWRDTHPDAAKEMKWMWEQSGRVIQGEAMTCGFERVLTDSAVESEAPQWMSFANTFGVQFIHGFNEKGMEHMLSIFPSSYQAVAGYQAGSVLNLYAYDIPLTQLFGNGVGDTGNGYDPYNMINPLMSRVNAARAWKPTYQKDTPQLMHDNITDKGWDTSLLPRQDYVVMDETIGSAMSLGKYLPGDMPDWFASGNASGNIEWRRQVLFVKDKDPNGANYYLFRDTISSDQPTDWTMWTLSDGIGTPVEAYGTDAEGNKYNKFPDERKGNTIWPERGDGYRKLLSSDRYTAVGQHGVDIEYYIAGPNTGDRYTMRYGWDSQGPYGSAYCPEGIVEYQDLLRMSLPGKGSYYVAYYPNKSVREAPEFSTVGNNIIKIDGWFGTDYAFLSENEITDASGDISFAGTAGSIQHRNDELVLSLGAKGSVSYKGFSLQADEGGADIVFSGNKVTVNIPVSSNATTIAFKAPGVTVTGLDSDESGIYTMTIPAGMTEISYGAGGNPLGLKDEPATTADF